MQPTEKLAYYQRRLQQTKEFKEMVPVALNILDEMRGKKIIQLCGPISTGGLDCKRRNLNVLSIAIKYFEQRGYFVFDQLFFEEHVQRIWDATIDGYPYMVLKEFYRPLFETEKIKCFYFLPFWRTSIGTIFEMDESHRLKIPKTVISWNQFFKILKSVRC